MATYSYVAVDQSGKEIKGTVDADNVHIAALELKGNGLFVASLTETSVLNRDIHLSIFEPKPTPRDMAVFCRQFVSIVNAGVSVITALEMLAEQTGNKRLQAAITGCRLNIEKGRSFSDAMSDFPQIFPSIFRTMVAAGEASGSLDVSFTRMAQQEEKSAKLKANIKKASIYPSVVFIVSIAVVIFMLVFIIPSYEDLFASLGTTLPPLTVAVVAASKFLTSRWYIVLPVIVGIVVGICIFVRGETGRRFFGGIALRLPLIKVLISKTTCANLSRTLSTLLAAGIPLIEAIEISSNVINNLWYKDAVLEARDSVAIGNPLSESLKATGMFPKLVYHMVGIGEETGDIDGMLTKLADYYEEEVEQTTQQVMAAIEPMIIIVLALVVGTLVLSMVLPMLNLYSAIDTM